MSLFSTLGRWMRFGGSLSENTGLQLNSPSAALVPGTANIGPDGALQLSAVWACVSRRATTIATLPLFVYKRDGNGQKELARGDTLYQLLHESPNSRMTPKEFWTAMLLNYDLRGNAYARIDRRSDGTAMALWPMPSDQVQVEALEDGSMVYYYYTGNNVTALAENSVLHLKDLGNGTTGFSKLDYMRATVDEAGKQQSQAAKTFATGGKPTGLLMVDKLLTKDQREQVRAAFQELETGSTSRLAVLEANMKYERLNLTPEQQQLMESRKFSVEEICRWFDVPPVLVHHSNVTTWGSGIEQIVDGFYKLSVRPMLVSIEQAITKRVMTPKQRQSMSVEFNFDALLRGNLVQRYQSYAQAVQNGFLTRNEVRQYENMPPVEGGDQLTAQVNLAPIAQLGQGATDADPQNA